ncbi:60S ribosomal protein L35a-3 [Hibiscus syriacus]|uniref:60S ribosomal protein L35a-3 n=1 Tax=Hibiscus syriacus TaxID=106335 RepID=A0A6A3B8S1_HIBSY|nr:60S ribosomal protein L35a-3 [Hibiscus syriacus]
MGFGICSWSYGVDRAGKMQQLVTSEENELRKKDSAKNAGVYLRVAQLNPFGPTEILVQNRCCSTSYAYFSSYKCLPNNKKGHSIIKDAPSTYQSKHEDGRVLKRMAYIYKAKVKKNRSHYRCIWGKVTRPHGNSGVVRAKFKSDLPPKSMGDKVRVFMYPSNS